MSSNIRNRVIAILAIVAVSAFSLFPRNVSQRIRRPDGTMVDTIVRRVPLKKGLDLAGGIHLALEIDESNGVVTDRKEAIQRALTVVRNRVDQFGVAEPVVQTVGEERIIVELPGTDDAASAERLVQQAALLEFQITDESRALERAFPRIDNILRQKGVERGVAGQPGTTFGDTSRALTGLFSNDTVRQDSAARARGDTTGLAQDSARDTTLLQSTDGPFSKLLQPGQMPGEYFILKKDSATIRRYLAMPEVQAALPPGKELRWGVVSDEPTRAQGEYLYVLDANPIMTGDQLIDAKPEQSPTEGTVVTFRLNQEGARKFGRETQRHLQDYMAIVLDNVVMGRPPVIQGQIRDRGQITMSGRPLQAAQDLALVLRAGALPVALKVVEARVIGPTLGEDAIRQGRNAGILGILLVVVIMIVYYRFSGFLAVLGLLFYALTTLAVLSGFGATLTLPGLAGFVLSIGMAVDANFLIFERIQEELDHGRTVRAAIDQGFDHAWSAIVDTHVTTALTALILYQFGTGPVQGFAVALLAGLAASLVSAVFVVRTLFLVWLGRTRGATTSLSI